MAYLFDLQPQPAEEGWFNLRGDLSEVKPGRAAVRLKTNFGYRDLVGTILQSVVRDALGDTRRVNFFHSDTGLLRPLADFEQYKPL